MNCCSSFGVPASMLPEVRPSSEIYGRVSTTLGVADVPIAGIAGDQQAALFGQMCTSPGLTKNTYGTGCFLLAEHRRARRSRRATGCSRPSRGGRRQDRCTPSRAASSSAARWCSGCATGWHHPQSADVEALATSVPDNGGVYLVPAFAGLGAPHWDPYARGTIVGLTRGTTAGTLRRAALESIAFQVADLLDAMQADAGIALDRAARGRRRRGQRPLMQFQADLLGVPVVRPQVTETTALGAAYLAGLAVGLLGLD